MALALMEGFDSYGAAADLAVNGFTNSGTISFSTTGGRWAGGAPSISGALNTITKTIPAIDASTAKIHAALWVKVADLPSTDVPFFRVGNSSSGTKGCLMVNAAGNLTIPRYGDSLESPVWSTTGGILSDLGWHHVEVEARWADSGGSIRVWIDGVLLINVSSVDTYSSGTPANSDTIVLVSGSSTIVHFDDVVVWDETGSDFVSTHLGEHRITTLRPDGDASVQFTPNSGSTNYTQVDEAPMHNADTDYVQSTTIGHKDLYDFASLPDTPNAIHAVGVRVRAKKTDVGAVNMHVHMKSGSTDVEGGDTSLTAGYQQYGLAYGKNPDTSAAWSTSDVNNIQGGMEYQA